MFTIHEIHGLDLGGFEDMDEMGEATGIKLPYVGTMDEGSGRFCQSFVTGVDGYTPPQRQFFIISFFWFWFLWLWPTSL